MRDSDFLDTKALDEAEVLPWHNRISYWTMLLTQGATAFTDNFVKMLMVAFAGSVALGTDIGDSMQVYLGLIFSIPYILFSPVAGWISDRYSKQRVMFWTLGMQTVGFVFFLGALALKDTQVTLWLSLACFFMVATQSAFFSPAKFGILKELVGSRRLGSGSGLMQMWNLAGTLAGMWAGPTWFKARLDAGFNEWDAVWDPMWKMTIISIIPMLMSLWIQRTPSHPEVKFKRSIWVEHLVNLKMIFRERPIMLASLGITYFWFLANAVGSILVVVAHDLFPHDKAGAAGAMATMPAMLGVGIVLGSLLAGLISRRRIELGLVPLSGLVLSASLLVIGGFWKEQLFMNGGLVLIGIAGGCFMSPLYAYVQDRAKPEERSRVMASVNLMDCIAAILANALLVKPMIALKLPGWIQLLVLAPLTFIAAIYITKLLPRSLLFLLASWLVKTFYRVRVLHADRVTREGVLLLPNHVSYADALMLGVSAPREVRFVMLETLYRIKWINWALRVFGTVPISASKAREAIKTVGEALHNKQAVVLYPEGQITRTGFINEIRKGYELMAKMGGARIQPVWLDGLWGSVFSFDGGKAFKKLPKRLRYPVNVCFGECLPVEDASPARVREEWTKLSLECFKHRVGKRKCPDGLPQAAWLNALRILDTALLHGVESIVCLFPKEHIMGQTFGIALAHLRSLKVTWVSCEHFSHGSLLVGPAYADEKGTYRSNNAFVVRLYEVGELKSGVTRGEGVGCYDAKSGTLLSLSVAQPAMPEGEEGRQSGWVENGLGHLLNGLSAQDKDQAIVIGGLGDQFEEQILIPEVGFDIRGFLEFKNVDKKV